MKIDKIFAIIYIVLMLFVVMNNKVYAYEDLENEELKVAISSIDDTVKSARNFISDADTTGTVNESDVKEYVGYIYNILLACGLVIAVAVGVFLGIKFMMDSAEGQAEVKEMLIPYVVGCVIIFGAFGIWKIVMMVMEGFNS